MLLIELLNYRRRVNCVLGKMGFGKSLRFVYVIRVKFNYIKNFKMCHTLFTKLLE